GERLKGGDKALFSGEFWTGREAVELGLIDGIGELRQVMRARYGDKVVLKRVDAPRPWWRRRFGLAGPAAPERPGPQDWVTGLLAAVEERALWSRFGL
ncbi:MAG: S49 family peptidase, partial [Kiloniellales bacterium]